MAAILYRNTFKIEKVWVTHRKALKLQQVCWHVTIKSRRSHDLRQLVVEVVIESCQQTCCKLLSKLVILIHRLAASCFNKLY